MVPVIEIDPASYAEEIALKEAILAGEYGYYYQALPQSYGVAVGSTGVDPP